MPVPDIKWAEDIFQNAFAAARFGQTTDHLLINAQLELCTLDWPVFDIAVSAMTYPFRYSDDEWTNLGALAIPPPVPFLSGSWNAQRRLSHGVKRSGTERD
jgi:hypothetical protein